MRAFQQILVKIDLPNVLVVVHSLLIDDGVIYMTRGRDGRDFYFDIVVSQSKLLHSLCWKVPAHRTIILWWFACRGLIQSKFRIFLLFPILELNSLCTSLCDLISAQILLIELVIVVILVNLHGAGVSEWGGAQRLSSLPKLLLYILLLIHSWDILISILRGAAAHWFHAYRRLNTHSFFGKNV